MDQEIARTLFERKVGLIENLGIFALKTILTLNSGATVVLLALLGNLQGKSGSFGVDLAQLQIAMIWFLFGIIAVMIAIAVTYVIAQMDVMRWPDGLAISAMSHLGLMLLPAVLGFLAFCIGFTKATYSFAPL